jgi:hypothetical protein
MNECERISLADNWVVVADARLRYFNWRAAAKSFRFVHQCSRGAAACRV